MRRQRRRIRQCARRRWARAPVEERRGRYPGTGSTALVARRWPHEAAEQTAWTGISSRLDVAEGELAIRTVTRRVGAFASILRRRRTAASPSTNVRSTLAYQVAGHVDGPLTR